MCQQNKPAAPAEAAATGKGKAASQMPNLKAPAQAPATPVVPAVTAEEVLDLLGSPRTSPFKPHFKVTTAKEHLGAYQWAQAVSASLLPLLGLCEVVLRNAIHQSLSWQCSKMTTESFPWYDRAEAASVPLKGKSKDKVEVLLFTVATPTSPSMRRAVQPTPDGVVAEMSVGFWPNLMESLSQTYAPRTFTDVFTHYPKSTPQHWSKSTNKEPVVARLKRLQDLRNRVCHHEPIWKHHWLGLDPQTQKHWSHTVGAMRALHKEMMELLEWISPTAVASYRSSFGYQWFDQLCTTHATLAFMDDHLASGRLERIEKREPPQAAAPAFAAVAPAPDTPPKT